MAEDGYVIAITALLPLTALMLVSQVNPYHALVIRGILGAIAALVYALFGAADVALTEALVGTMLSITLYAVAVRSSMSMRLGILERDMPPPLDSTPPAFVQVQQALREMLHRYHLRLEVINYQDLTALHTALETREIHATCVSSDALQSDFARVAASQVQTPLSSTPADDSSTSTPPVSLVAEPSSTAPPYQLRTRVPRLYSLMAGELPPKIASLTDLQLVPSSSQESAS